MDPALTSLLAASIAFVGSHFVMSHPWRGAMVRIFGEKGFLAIYSLVSLAAFGWMIVAFRAAPRGGSPAWTGQDDASWAIASLLTIVALVLFLGSLRGNPALPNIPAGKVAASEPRGVFLVTRHPMMWGFALWAIAHLLIAPTARTLILAGAILILALGGAHLQDRQKEALRGQAWKGWLSRTSYWPRWRMLHKAGGPLWLISLLLWLVITRAHIWFGSAGTGIWRWIG